MTNDILAQEQRDYMQRLYAAGVTKHDIHEKTGVSLKTIERAEKGLAGQPSLKAIIAEYGRLVPFKTGVPDVAPPAHNTGDEFVPVPFLEAKLSMGGGSWEVSPTIKKYLGFRGDWIVQRTRSPKSLAIYLAEGDSMDPTIPDGAIVLVDQSKKEVISDRIYMIGTPDGAKIKRLLKQDGKIFIVSDGDIRNGAPHKEEVREGEYFEVFGRVLWYAAEIA
jgi:phage repressor protein C with HTH and peptisase S24 domain